MENKLNNIVSETCGISASLEAIDGQMTFFSHLIDNCERYKDLMALKLQHGELQKQLNAIYTLFNYELERLKEYNERISTEATQVATDESEQEQE